MTSFKRILVFPARYLWTELELYFWAPCVIILLVKVTNFTNAHMHRHGFNSVAKMTEELLATGLWQDVSVAVH